MALWPVWKFREEKRIEGNDSPPYCYDVFKINKGE